MKKIRILIEVQLPDNYNENMVNSNIANAIINANGDLLEIKEYQDINNDLNS